MLWPSCLAADRGLLCCAGRVVGDLGAACRSTPLPAALGLCCLALPQVSVAGGVCLLLGVTLLLLPNRCACATGGGLHAMGIMHEQPILQCSRVHNLMLVAAIPSSCPAALPCLQVEGSAAGCVRPGNECAAAALVPGSLHIHQPAGQGSAHPQAAIGFARSLPQPSCPYAFPNACNLLPRPC